MSSEAERLAETYLTSMRGKKFTTAEDGLDLDLLQVDDFLNRFTDNAPFQINIDHIISQAEQYSPLIKNAPMLDLKYMCFQFPTYEQYRDSGLVEQRLLGQRCSYYFNPQVLPEHAFICINASNQSEDAKFEGNYTDKTLNSIVSMALGVLWVYQHSNLDMTLVNSMEKDQK